MRGKLVLADGAVFHGILLDGTCAVGEVVFNTGMTGYQEVLTDPSYCGQIVTMTYPLIGNYGVNSTFNQSAKPYVRGFIISELCPTPSSWQAEASLTGYLRKNNIPCLYNIDTRAVTRHIRTSGAMKGVIVPGDTDEETIQGLLAMQEALKPVEEVTTTTMYAMPNKGPKVVVLDLGVKQNILNSLHRAGCQLFVVPASTSAAEILSYEPDGIFLSNGPGDPKDVPYAIDTIKELFGKKPIFGICLGHQLLALALGGNTYKLKFGHRGANQPVKDLRSGRVYITSQNHGYAVDETSLANTGLAVSHRAVNDETVEGLKHKVLPVFSVQYHPEAAPGPDDNTYLFDEFLSLMVKENYDCAEKE